MISSRFKFVLLLAVLGLFLVGCEGSTELAENEVRIRESASILEGSNYENVVEQLQVWGFTNIETVAVYDIVWGITKEGTTISVKIGGSVSFSRGDVYNKDTLIVVTYSMRASDDPAKITYEIIWENEDGSIIKTDEYLLGFIPEYIGTTPVKESTNESKFTFNGWTPNITEVSGNQTYTALFIESVNTYNITWLNYDGSILTVDSNVEFGTLPIYDGEVPIRDTDEEFSYEFDGWYSEKLPVNGNVEYIATFKETKKTYTVTWTNNEGTIIAVNENVEYGVTPSFDGVISLREPTAEFTYSFGGWTPNVGPITGDQIYEAIIVETKNRYSITIDTSGGELKNTEINFEYGTTFYSLAEPRLLGFVFTGWSLGEEEMIFPYTLKDDIQISANYREMQPHELIWDYYAEVTNDHNIIVNYEDEYVEILTGDTNAKAIFNKDGQYGFYYDLNGYEFIIVIDLISSTIHYVDQYGWFYERDLLYKTYDGNVSMADYHFIEEFFTVALESLNDGLFLSISETYGKTVELSDFNDNWSDLLVLPDNHYKTYEMIVMDNILLDVYHFELSPSGNYVYYYVSIKNNSSEVITFLEINLDFVDYAIYGVSTVHTASMYWWGTLQPGATTSDYILIQTSFLFTKTVQGSSTNYMGLYTDIYPFITNIRYTD